MDNGHVSVPVASDGTFFSPEYKRKSGYQIGPKHAERWCSTYWEALEALTRDICHWRRPNENGKYGIVVARRWIQIPRTDLMKRFAQRLCN